MRWLHAAVVAWVALLAGRQSISRLMHVSTVKRKLTLVLWIMWCGHLESHRTSNAPAKSNKTTVINNTTVVAPPVFGGFGFGFGFPVFMPVRWVVTVVVLHCTTTVIHHPHSWALALAASSPSLSSWYVHNATLPTKHAPPPQALVSTVFAVVSAMNTKSKDNDYY